jgi:heme-degrading monooxygenase HmoA
MELWKAEDNSVLAVSRWESREAVDEYTNHPMFKQHHGDVSSQGGATYYEAKVL